jgi:hypothetical protein
MKKLLLLCFVGAFMGSCAVDSLDAPSLNTPEEISDPYAVTIDKAVGMMNELIGDLYGPVTRNSARVISSIETMKSPETQTRSGMKMSENLAYIVNFTNNGGYAILGADQRVPPVLCIVESGSLSLTEALGASLQSSMTSMVERFYTQGSGWSPDCEYVGRNNSSDQSSDYDCDGDGTADWPTSPDSLGGGGGDDDGKVYPWIPPPDLYYYKWTPWQWKIDDKFPLLTTQWHRGSPFNQSTNGGEVSSEAISIAQVLAFHGLPKVSYFGVTSSWSAMREHNYTGNTTVPEYLKIRADLSNIINKIGIGLNGFSGSVENRISKYLNDLPFYEQATITPFELYLPALDGLFWSEEMEETGLAYEMHHNRVLLAICTPDTGGEPISWVIDGYVHQIRSYLAVPPTGVRGNTRSDRYCYLTPSGAVEGDPDGPGVEIPNPNGPNNNNYNNRLEGRTLLHCNFGSGGVNDGWYNVQLILEGIPGFSSILDNDGNEIEWNDSNHISGTVRIVKYAIPSKIAVDPKTSVFIASDDDPVRFIL